MHHDNKVFSNTSLYLISTLFLAFSAYRIWTVYYAPKIEPIPVASIEPAPVVPPPVSNPSVSPPAPPVLASPEPLNISRLLGLDVVDVKAKMGPPTRAIDNRTRPKISSFLVYEQKDGVTKFVVSYDSATGEVRDLSVYTDLDKTLEQLLDEAHLETPGPSSNYFIELLPKGKFSEPEVALLRGIRVRATDDPALKGRVMVALTSPMPPWRFSVSPTTAPVVPEKFDVPRLVNMDFAAIKNELGAPLESRSDTKDKSLTVATYQRGLYKLLVRYNAKTQQVADFYLPSAKPEGYVSYTRVLEGGQIPVGSSTQYRCVYNIRPGSSRVFLGVKVIPYRS